jgi:hypothetical protein
MSEVPSRKERKQFLPSKSLHQRKGFETKTAANFLIIKEIIINSSETQEETF